MYALGFTGTRSGMTSVQRNVVANFLLQQRSFITEAHHGDCIGADAEFDEECLRLEVPRVIHPPVSDVYRANRQRFGISIVCPPKEYLERDVDIVIVTNILLAAPKGEEINRSVTWHTIRCARKEGRLIYIVYPDGGLVCE